MKYWNWQIIRGWYGFVSEAPIVIYMTHDGRFGNQISWWSTIVLPHETV